MLLYFHIRGKIVIFYNIAYLEMIWCYFGSGKIKNRNCFISITCCVCIRHQILIFHKTAYVKKRYGVTFCRVRPNLVLVT